VTFLNYVGVGPNTNPLLENVPYKVYTGPSVGDLFFENEEQLRNSLQRYTGKPISFHVEDYGVLMVKSEKETHTLRRPVECVETALQYVLAMIEEFSIPAKLCHWSTGGESFEMIRQHRERNIIAGLPYTTIEVSPLHLLYDEDMLKYAPERWPYVQMNPALQSVEHRRDLIEGLRNGFIDYVATDHAPHTLDEKFVNFVEGTKELRLSPEEWYLHLKGTSLAECQRRSVLDGTSGTPQLDTYGLIAAWLLGENGFSPQDVARVTSYNPGVFLNQFVDRKFGKIAEGYQGSLTVLDLSSSTKIERTMLQTKVGWSPFEGMVFPGRVAMTMIQGIPYTSSL
jgi:dihydroorotase